MVDMAHIAGLVATGVHPSPFPYADIVTTTTHKTLRGPRGAIIFGRAYLMPAINKSVFPGMQGGPHNNQTLAIGVALEEANNDSFKSYAQEVVANAQTLSKELANRGFDIVSGGTDNHLFLIDLSAKNISGKEAEEILYSAGIIANRNTVPNDPRKPQDPSGIRMGTPAVTTRGFGKKEMQTIATWVRDALDDPSTKNIARIHKEVLALTSQFPPPGF